MYYSGYHRSSVSGQLQLGKVLPLSHCVCYAVSFVGKRNYVGNFTSTLEKIYLKVKYHCDFWLPRLSRNVFGSIVSAIDRPNSQVVGTDRDQGSSIGVPIWRAPPQKQTQRCLCTSAEIALTFCMRSDCLHRFCSPGSLFWHFSSCRNYTSRCRGLRNEKRTVTCKTEGSYCKTKPLRFLGRQPDYHSRHFKSPARYLSRNWRPGDHLCTGLNIVTHISSCWIGIEKWYDV